MKKKYNKNSNLARNSFRKLKQEGQYKLPNDFKNTFPSRVSQVGLYNIGKLTSFISDLNKTLSKFEEKGKINEHEENNCRIGIPFIRQIAKNNFPLWVDESKRQLEKQKKYSLDVSEDKFFSQVMAFFK